MSNNKQSMKLYTEEELRKAISIGLSVGYSPAFQIGDMNSTITKIHKDITPIELPSDDMAVIALKTISKLNPKLKENEEAFYIAGFVECAKWMRDKIQGCNNEQ